MENFDLKNIAPKLTSIEKKNPFEVPEGYFETFPDKLLNKINEEQTKKSPFNRIVSIIKPQLKLAAAFLLLAMFAFLITYFITDNQTDNLTNNNIPESQLNSPEQYIIDYIDNDEIISMINNDTLSSDDEIDNETIVEYLIDNDVDVEYLAYINE
ncbi:MAG: hypothetical protein Kow0068_00980 [Marinilabiliales bacterium]